MTTLYVTDLDGTLLNSASAVSPTSVKIINDLIEQGLWFTVATARSPYTALPILGELDLRLPMAFINGVFVYDPISRTELARNLIRPETAATAVDVLLRMGLRPLVFTIDAGGHHRIHHLGEQNASEQNFTAVRLARGDRRFQLVTDFAQALSEEILTVIAIDTPDRIDPVLAELPADLYAHLGPDRGVPGYAWLELCHPLANKADAVRFIRDHVSATRLVCFGDNANDLPMFAIADESYAVANATEAALAAAGGTVGPNDEDGVARHLQRHLRAG
ncbi:hypothetical protein HDA40_000890 [Hamadaea flava]|uniref:HAD-IIB family hydrolase n=1 Tax=Hamadaea flava TaxID=1742688 RepID=A0ABV8LPR4_9ACTN|nr:HAD-IIB family hydrolase [Hamadaea flava]MCP2322383.1 hypothetical protein [Hamadaea flava]